MSSNSYEKRTGGPIHLRVPPDDNIERLTCNECGFINYINPKVIVGAVCTWDNKFLLCKRAIEPRIGFWTMPAGFMEENETSMEGAKREAWEEAGARIEVNELIGVYNVARLSQVHLIYRAKLINDIVNAGPESQEVRFFSWAEIPWNDLAFPSVHWALNHYKEVEELVEFSPRSEEKTS